MDTIDPLPSSPAAERNKQPILDVLRTLLPGGAAQVLEVASGTGQHAAHFAAAHPAWRWQPSDGDAAALPTIARRCAPWPNVAAPLHLDLLAPGAADAGAPRPQVAVAGAALPGPSNAGAVLPDLSNAGAVPPDPDLSIAGAVPPGGPFDAVFAANLLHISPWPVCAALMRLAAAQLREGGRLVVYGPFDVEGEPLAASNRAFDADLRARDSRWGLRRLGEVQAEAARAGLVFEQRVAMPANNLVLVWRRAGGTGSGRRVHVAGLVPADAPAYRTLMLEAYTLAADAFTSTAEERQAEPLAWWERRIAGADGLTQAFGACMHGELVGTVALEFSAKPKTRHSALLIGMYVRPAARGHGAGAALVQAAIAAARARPGVRQLRLSATEGNEAALGLYRSAGFAAWGIEPEAIVTPGGFRGKVYMTMALAPTATAAAAAPAPPPAGGAAAAG